MKRSIENQEICFLMRWYLRTEKSDPKYKHLLQEFHSTFQQHQETFKRQEILVQSFKEISNLLKKSKWIKSRKKILINLFEENYSFLKKFDPPLPLPLDCSILVTGIVPDQCHVFSSNARPIKFTFKTVNDTFYSVIYKEQDDLRLFLKFTFNYFLITFYYF